MGERNLPPIHDAVRLWVGGDEQATLRACMRYRQKQRPGWSLSWLRESVSRVFSGKLSKSAIKVAVRTNVPADSRKSVWQAVVLLLSYVKKWNWEGVELSGRDVPVGRDCTVHIRPFGKFFSGRRKAKCLLALQPRLDSQPDYEQFRIWRSALHYEFCCDPLEPLEAIIIDL